MCDRVKERKHYRLVEMRLRASKNKGEEQKGTKEDG